MYLNVVNILSECSKVNVFASGYAQTLRWKDGYSRRYRRLITIPTTLTPLGCRRRHQIVLQRPQFNLILNKIVVITTFYPLSTLPEYTSSIFSLSTILRPFVLYSFSFKLSALWITTSDYPFGIFEHLLLGFGECESFDQMVDNNGWSLRWPQDCVNM
jgi:hypothetical protein